MYYQSSIIGAEPITLEQAKVHLRTIPDDASEDLYITSLISGAREWCENHTGIALVEQEITAYFECGEVLTLPRPPVNAVTAVVSDGEEVEFVLNKFTGKVALDGVHKEIYATYNAGYSKDRQFPFSIAQAILLIVAHWYMNRTAVEVGAVAGIEVPLGAYSILNQYRKVWL